MGSNTVTLRFRLRCAARADPEATSETAGSEVKALYMRLDDPTLDSIASETRDAFPIEAVRSQIAFMRAKVPYWRERLATTGVGETSIETMRDLGRFPVLSKEELRSIRPSALLPEGRLADMVVCRWTSGTSPVDGQHLERDGLERLGGLDGARARSTGYDEESGRFSTATERRIESSDTTGSLSG